MAQVFFEYCRNGNLFVLSLILIIKMWVSILQNGRKKEKQQSSQKIQQFLKLTEKSSYSTSMSRSTLLPPTRPEQKNLSMNKQKQNLGARLPSKLKNTQSSVNLLVNRSNLFDSYLGGVQDSDGGKKVVVRAEQAYSLSKTRKMHESVVMIQKTEKEKDSRQLERKNAYFFRLLGKKNKQRSELNINIHNSIYTFKQFIRACSLANPKPVDTRLSPETQGRKTIVFDMDETLIHTNETATPNYQIRVPFRSFQGRVGYGFVEVRPHCKQILKRLSQHFDIVIFTASTQAYADPIIDHIDPERVVKFRLYRQSCSLVKNQIFVKDLRVLGRKLSNVVLVDNAPYSYLMQLDNGIPIIPYYRGKDDDELLALEEYLMKFREVDDVRPLNREYFKLQEYVKYDSYEKVVAKLYGEWLPK